MKTADRCAADPGWVTGHSYIVYGPLLNGATSFMFEGGPAYPYPNRWSAVSRTLWNYEIPYTAPTAIRGLMRFGEAWPNKHDLSSLRLLGSVGEPINPEAWKWYYQVHWEGKLPDHGYLVADRDRYVHDHAHPGDTAQSPALVHVHSLARKPTSWTSTAIRSQMTPKGIL